MKRKITVIILINIVLFLLINPLIRKAQYINNDWPQPINVSESDEYSTEGFVIVDDNHRLHIVWGEENAEPENKTQSDIALSNVIYYRYIDGTSKSVPVDIITVKENKTLRPEVLRLDNLDRLLLLWHDNEHIWLSIAPIDQATIVRAWETVDVAGPGRYSNYGMDMEISQDGTIWISYINENNLVNIIKSQDNGQTWSLPHSLGDVSVEGDALGFLRLAINVNKYLYITWTELSEKSNWLPNGIWYTGSENNGDTWSIPIPIITAVGHGQSDINGNNNGEVHLVWNRSVGSVDGRYHSVSYNHGISWTKPEPIFPGASGLTGSPAILVDNEGKFHILSSSRIDEEKIFYSYFNDIIWIDPLIISDNLLGSEHVHATMNQGNLIAVAWNDFDTKEVYIYIIKIDVSRESSNELNSVDYIASSTSRATEHKIQTTSTATTEIAGYITSPSDSKESNYLNQLIIFIGIVPIFLLLLGIILVNVHRDRIHI